jgi:hypothetical protein
MAAMPPQAITAGESVGASFHLPWRRTAPRSSALPVELTMPPQAGQPSSIASRRFVASELLQ